MQVQVQDYPADWHSVFDLQQPDSRPGAGKLPFISNLSAKMKKDCKYDYELLASDLNRVINSICDASFEVVSEEQIAREVGISTPTLRKALDKRPPKRKDSLLSISTVRILSEWLGVHSGRYILKDNVTFSMKDKWILRSRGSVLN